jgi:hypothetical protein
MQLRFASFGVISLRRDFHPQECAHAGRTGIGKPRLPTVSLSGLRMIEAPESGGLGKRCLPSKNV